MYNDGIFNFFFSYFKVFVTKIYFLAKKFLVYLNTYTINKEIYKEEIYNGNSKKCNHPAFTAKFVPNKAFKDVVKYAEGMGI